MAKLAVLILTFNEEKNIEACINSASFADEVIVVDSLSTDNTVAIAKSLGVTVCLQVMNAGFGIQRNFALAQTQSEWVLYLDADERITSELAIEIREIVDRGELCAYEILRENIVFGKKIYHGSHSPDWSLRLYPRTAIHWEGLVHEKACVTLPVARCKGIMLHYTYTSWEKYFNKFNQYTSLMAEKNFLDGKRASFKDIILRPLFGFVKMYFLKRGFQDGRLGFVLAIVHAFYTFVKYIKLDYLSQAAKRKEA